MNKHPILLRIVCSNCEWRKASIEWHLDFDVIKKCPNCGTDQFMLSMDRLETYKKCAEAINLVHKLEAKETANQLKANKLT